MIAVDYDVIGKLYLPSIESECRYIFNEGGTRSGKTFTTLQVFFHLAAASDKPLILSVVSETMPHLRKGAMRDFFIFLKENDLYQVSKHNKTENSYEIGKSIIEFFSADSSDKVHGPERDYLFVNELQNVPYETFFHLAQRTRLKVFADWNPTHEFFVHTKYLNNQSYKDDITYIHSTIFDNPFVSPEIKKEVLRRAEHDRLYRTVYLEGKIGIREGLVFDNWQQVDSMPDGPVKYGLDFGYTNDPSVLVKVVELPTGHYVEEMFYETGLLNREIAAKLKTYGIKPGYDEIIADSAEPKSIDEIRLAGFNVKPSIKGKDSITTGIDRLKSKPLFITKQSTNIIRELRNYSWVTDKEGKPTNKPIDEFNHGIDAMRYAISTKTQKNFVL